MTAALAGSLSGWSLDAGGWYVDDAPWLGGDEGSLHLAEAFLFRALDPDGDAAGWVVVGDGRITVDPRDPVGRKALAKHKIAWEWYYDPEKEGDPPKEVRSGTRVAIELAGRYFRGRGSVEEYLEQTAIANPHVTFHFTDPEGETRIYERSTRTLPAEPKEIKPHRSSITGWENIYDSPTHRVISRLHHRGRLREPHADQKRAQSGFVDAIIHLRPKDRIFQNRARWHPLSCSV